MGLNTITHQPPKRIAIPHDVFAHFERCIDSHPITHQFEVNRKGEKIDVLLELRKGDEEDRIIYLVSGKIVRGNLYILNLSELKNLDNSGLLPIKNTRFIDLTPEQDIGKTVEAEVNSIYGPNWPRLLWTKLRS